MGKYLKKFENHSAYEAAESGLILPNVSLCVQEHDVHYNPSTPTPSHDYVEIGGIKWATMNVGANSVTDYGLYFQWGDTQGYTPDQVGSGEGQKYFGWSDYKYCNGTSSPSDTDITKYGRIDGKTVLEASDDAVTAAWGSQWRMPYKSEYVALGNAVNTEWTTNYQGSGVAGLVCTDKTDSSKVLFFPICGICIDGSVDYVGSIGNYWSRSVTNAVNYLSGYCLHLQLSTKNSNVKWTDNYSRYFGNPVRGLLVE